MMEQMIAFKVKPIPIPPEGELDEEMRRKLRVGMWGEEFDSRRDIGNIVSGKEWLVVAIKHESRLGGRYSFDRIHEDMFLLARDGQVPRWYPSCMCEVVG